jgi:glycosyltransferase involved in cell wall biosynthesis
VLDRASGETPQFSVVIPIYNEEENILELYNRLTAVMNRLCESEGYNSRDYEIIMVDDGSSDNSWALIKSLNEKDNRVKGISFSRNFGHHIAITAGIDYARGNAIILMDGDLQDPPEEIPRLFDKFKEGYDLVYAIRRKRKDSAFKKITSWIFLRMLKKISNVDINLESGIFSILSKRHVENMKKLREKSRFIVGLMSWVGFSQTGVEIERHERYAGRSKYSLFKLFRLAWHGVTSFSYIPLQLATYFGFGVATISFLIGLYMIYKKLFLGIPILGYASIIVSLFFLGGVILLVLGVIGEYIGRIYTEVQNRPLYVIKEERG